MLDISMTVRVAGRQSPDTVWNRYFYPVRWKEWSPSIADVRASGDRLRPGLTGKVTSRVGGSVGFEVTAVDLVRRTWSWTVKAGPITLVLDHSVSPIPTGTATALRVRGPAPVVLAYLPIARLALWQLVNKAPRARTR